MRKLFNFPKIPKKVFYVAIIMSVIGLFVAHVWVGNKLSNDLWVVAQQESDLREKILADANVSSKDRFRVDVDAIITQSPMALAYAELEKRRQRISNTLDLLGPALAIWPMVIILAVVWGGTHYWEGKGLEPTKLQVRRNRVRLIGIFAIATLLTVIIILWRFVASSRWRPLNATFLISVAIFVVSGGIALVNVLWSLMSSPMSRLSTRMKSVPRIYRLSIHAVVVAMVAFVTVGDLYDLFGSQFGRSVDPLTLLGVQSVAWLATIIALGSVMLGYLRLPDKSPERNEEKSQRRESLEPPPEKDMAVVVPRTYSSNYTTDLSKVSEKIETLVSLLEVANHRAVESAGQTHKRQRAQRSDEIVRQRAELIGQRLLAEVHSLTRRGNVNLMIGSVTSLIAATILWMLVAQAPIGTPGTTALVGYYVPRLSVAVFIEVFSFFFLRLYKNGLSEIMYYQNELTNLESKMLALEIAALLPSNDAVHQILQDLSKTDRNFVLKVGESTVELEKVKVDQQNIQSLFDNFISKLTEVKDALKVGK